MSFFWYFFLEFQVTINSVAFCSTEKPATELTATELTVDSIYKYRFGKVCQNFKFWLPSFVWSFFGRAKNLTKDGGQYVLSPTYRMRTLRTQKERQAIFRTLRPRRMKKMKSEYPYSYRDIDD